MTPSRRGAVARKVCALALAAATISIWRRLAHRGHQKRNAREPGVSPECESTKKRPHSASAAGGGKRHRQDGSSVEAEPSRRPGSVTDTSALLAAKVAVPDADQSDPLRLGQHYLKIAAKFQEAGLNLSAVVDSAKYFSVHGGRAQPLAYADFETPLARGAVRLGVYRLTDANSGGLASDALEAAQSVMAALPPGSAVHTNDAGHYHVTVQMISHPSDPRPDPFASGGGLDPAHVPNPIPAPTTAAMRRELDVYSATAAAGPPPRLEVHSVVFADSGSLLLLLTDGSGVTHALRKRLRQALPGCAAKQPTIIHVTLARLLAAEQLEPEARHRVTSECNRWTDKLRGRLFTPESLWHVQENTFTLVNVDETSAEFQFAPPAGHA